MCIPRTISSATRYGKGRVRLKESSSGSTAGLPSIVIAKGDSACDAALSKGMKNERLELAQERETVVVGYGVGNGRWEMDITSMWKLGGFGNIFT